MSSPRSFRHKLLTVSQKKHKANTKSMQKSGKKSGVWWHTKPKESGFGLKKKQIIKLVGKKKKKMGSWSVTSKKRVIRRDKTSKALKRKSYKRK